MSVRWIVWAESQIGFVEAPTKGMALGRAMSKFDTDSVRVTQVQAEASYTIAEEERKAMERNKRLGYKEEDEEC
jgi:hypothetical protein